LGEEEREEGGGEADRADDEAGQVQCVDRAAGPGLGGVDGGDEADPERARYPLPGVEQGVAVG